MGVLKIEDYVKAKHFPVFVFNDNSHAMLVQKNGRLDIPFGKVERDDDEIEAAVRRVVFAETKTALKPIVPVTALSTKSRSGSEIPTVILAARMDGEAQIKEDEKTHHCLIEERNFLRQSGYRNKAIKDLLEEAKRVLWREEIRMEHDEETQCEKEKYNYRTLV